jgi:hypothetical protein
MTSAVFTGVVRDCARYLPGVLGNLERFARFYDQARFVFVVSDTADRSAAMLARWVGSRGRVIDAGMLRERLPRRTERLAFARNLCLDEIRGFAAGSEHLVMLDLDDVLAEPVSSEAFADAAAWLDADPRRAGAFANSTPRYYDTWALRHPRWCAADCWQPIWHRPPGETYEAAKFREVFARQIAIPPGLPPIAVDSAFGGLGLYRMAYALQARYRGLAADGEETCEHVAFNRDIRAAGGDLHIFPLLRVHAPPEHLYRAADFRWPWRLRMARNELIGKVRPPWRRLALAPRSNRANGAASR